MMMVSQKYYILEHCLCEEMFSPVPEPRFEFSVYTVPEDDLTVPLCVEIGVAVSESLTYTITAIQKDPPEAEGRLSIFHM